MPQTMMALLAMMLATLFAYNQQQRAAQTKFNMIRDEVVTQATIVAQDRLEEIGAMAFDEATVGANKVATAAELTGLAFFTEDAQGNDIDDFHQVVVDTVRSSNLGKLRFRVASTVTYADPNNPDVAVTGPSKAKKATVRVTSLDIAEIMASDEIILSQTYTCGSRCGF
jgi:hypothetical protein